MSKRKSGVVGSPNNTLLNYFLKKQPPTKKAKVDETSSVDEADSAADTSLNSDVQGKSQNGQPSSPRSILSDSDDEILLPTKKRKRIRINPVDSDSDTENKDNLITSTTEKCSVEKKQESLLSKSFQYTPNKDTAKVKIQQMETHQKTPVKVKQPQTEKTLLPQPPVSDNDNWAHCKLEWLKPHKIKDAFNRRPDHPDYDPTTLFVPPAYIREQTPAHQQWWEMKSTHYDCVLFFKVGKFYELYHMDAAVGVNELGFSYMKGEFAHSGFPESAYARMASTLVAKGYKVARVEQTETPDMMQERCKKQSNKAKVDKVVRREICQVTLRGTQVCGLQDPGPGEPAANYMLAIVEEENQGCSTYGVCFVDASIGVFHLGQFKDDKHSSRLLTTMAHYPPALIIYDRKTSARTSKLLSTHCYSARREARVFWPPEKTLKVLAQKHYKTDADGEWPEGIRQFLHEGDVLGLTPAKDCYLSVKSLGGCVTYLADCLLDIQVLAMAQFTAYAPPDVVNETLSQVEKVENRWEGGSTMVLDAITLRNLRIVQHEGCLYDKINFCSTPFGKRLLYQWVCAPSCKLSTIKQRQDAIKTLMENVELCQDTRAILTALPDLERLLAKVHTLGNLLRSKQHPDSRAIFYEEKVYSKRKVLDFIAVLNGFTSAAKLVGLFAKVESPLLRRLTQLSPDGNFPDYSATLKFFKEGFNQSEAEKEGRILPGEGVDAEYDSSLQLIEKITEELQQYLDKQEKYFKCGLKYVGTDKKRYQIEVPESAASRAGGDYNMEGARKGFKRFSTDKTKVLLARMKAAEEQKTNVLKDLNRRIFERFSSHRAQWEAALQCIAALDVLISLAEFARQQQGDVCLPDITFDKAQQPYINIVEGRHPCIPIVNEFIPNDTTLGGGEGSLLLLTGPNMGGKSTLMRQVGLLTVLAHLGSYVPAQSCGLSLVDRVFTRLGASDDILSGQSTFLVEMNETAAIMKHATVHSLVLLDELGRGTSTYDGTAIASGVCAALAVRGCRSVFSTHYHSLVHHLAGQDGVTLGHMACMVETDETTPDNEDEIPEETITFLYKLSPGACPKSYGFNAARLAGIPKEITRRAHKISKDLEREATCVRAFRHIVKMDGNAQDVRQLLAGLTI